MDKEQYHAFVAGLIDGEKTEFKEWEKDTPYFDGCMPIEVMAERGVETLRFGPMKGVGLDNPRTGRWPYAVVQLRQDNALGTLWNMVGFQTKLKHADAGRTVPHHPGAGKCRIRAAGRAAPQQLHPLARTARRRAAAEIRAAYPLRRADHRLRGLCRKRRDRPDRRALRRRRTRRTHAARRRRPKTALGALLGHITGGADAASYQPMNVNFGLFPPMADSVRKADRKLALTARAGEALAGWVKVTEGVTA